GGVTPEPRNERRSLDSSETSATDWSLGASVGSLADELLAPLRQAHAEQRRAVPRRDVATRGGDDRQSLAQGERGELPIDRVAGVNAVGRTAVSQLAS